MFHFQQATLPTALSTIQRAHHEAYYPTSAMPNINLTAFAAERVYNPTFVVIELRVAVMIMRRALLGYDNGEIPPYLTMETRQVLGKGKPMQGLRLRAFCTQMATAILEAGDLLAEGRKPNRLATHYQSYDPHWRDTDRCEVHDLLENLLRITQTGNSSTLIIRYSTRSGLTVSTHMSHARAKQHVEKYVVFSPRRGKEGESVVSMRVAYT